MLLRGDLFASHAVRRHERRSAELRTASDEEFFEERRALKAYPPLGKAWQWRLLGGLTVVAVLGSLITHEWA